MTVDLVIAHYKDDLGWVRRLLERCPGVRPRIYTKWDGPYKEPFPGAVLLPNVGMCDHAWLSHIVTHYDALADWTVFTVDYPWDAGVTEEALPEMLVPADGVKVPWLCRVRDWDAGTGRIRWESFGNRKDRNGTDWAAKWKSGVIARAELSLLDWSRTFLGYDPDRDGWPGYMAGGVFACPKRALTQYPREFWERLRGEMSRAVQQEEGHYLERLWIATLCGYARHTPAPVHPAPAGAVE